MLQDVREFAGEFSEWPLPIDRVELGSSLLRSEGVLDGAICLRGLCVAEAARALPLPQDAPGAVGHCCPLRALWVVEGGDGLATAEHEGIREDGLRPVDGAGEVLTKRLETRTRARTQALLREGGSNNDGATEQDFQRALLRWTEPPTGGDAHL
eukprot:569689-Alexandrium_andersonii.AAC.1